MVTLGSVPWHKKDQLLCLEFVVVWLQTNHHTLGVTLIQENTNAWEFHGHCYYHLSRALNSNCTLLFPTLISSDYWLLQTFRKRVYHMRVCDASLGSSLSVLVQDSEQPHAWFHYSETFRVGTARAFRSFHGCVRYYDDIFVDLLQGMAFHLARRFGGVNYVVMALLDIMRRYVEYGFELSRLSFLLPRILIGNVIAYMAFSELSGQEMLHAIDFRAPRYFRLSIMDGNISRLEERIVQIWHDGFTDVIRVVQCRHGGSFLR